MLLGQLVLGTLDDRRTLYTLMFIYNIINSHIQCPGIIEKINFRVPNNRLRQRNNASYFMIPKCSPIYRDSTLISALNTYNKFACHLDLSMETNMYRNKCRTLVEIE
uniref:Uncharacterized protein n=1 Tax=Cacopsylla melanoneura TaxID=428564 RepID=A0A8D8TYS7_9HEMI